MPKQISSGGKERLGSHVTAAKARPAGWVELGLNIWLRAELIKDWSLTISWQDRRENDVDRNRPPRQRETTDVLRSGTIDGRPASTWAY